MPDDIFILRKNPYNSCNTHLFELENPQPGHVGVDATTFHAGELWS